MLALLVGALLDMELRYSMFFVSLKGAEFALEKEVTSFDMPRNKTDSISNIKPPDNGKEGFRLAFEQSYGYFYNSISDEEWILRQIAARNSSFHRYKEHPRRHWDKPNVWYYNNYDPIFSCPFRKRVQGLGDGPKWTCDPHQLKRLATERPCLLYSIGSNGNYQWEDGMFIETDGLCEIHVFDFSQNYTRKKNSMRNIHFHQWGLQGSREPRQGPAWRTLPEIIRELGHENRTIDVLKIDCEGCEWDTYQDWIHLDIRQILIETHSLPKQKGSGLRFFDSFTRQNFLMFSKEVNPWGGGGCLEFSYIKLHPDFLGSAYD